MGVVGRSYWCFEPCQPQRLHQRYERTSTHLCLFRFESYETAKFFKIHEISLDTNTKQMNRFHTDQYLHTRACTYDRTHTHTHTHAHTHTRTHTRTHTHTRMHTQAHAHTHTHTHTHTYTHINSLYTVICTSTLTNRRTEGQADRPEDRLT